MRNTSDLALLLVLPGIVLMAGGAVIVLDQPAHGVGVLAVVLGLAMVIGGVAAYLTSKMSAGEVNRQALPSAQYMFGMVVARIIVSLMLLLGTTAIAIYFVQVVGVLMFLTLIIVYCWMIYLFFQYRAIRQDEVVHLLATAAEARQPLAPALWAYLVDRPRTMVREFVIAIFLSVVYWGWVRRNTFDYKTERMAILLEAGVPLHEALRLVPGVAARETVLAAAVGQSTGKLAPSLQQVARWRSTSPWRDVMPRFMYPILVLLVVFSVVSFHSTFIIPKFERIFADFKNRLPPLTQAFIYLSRTVLNAATIPLLFIFALVPVLMWLASGAVRWHFPLIGAFYRLHIQSRTLKMLGVLLESGQTTFQALETLISSGYFKSTALRRLHRVQDDIREGQPLADALYRHGLLPRRMVPLLHSAEKANNLPWVLSESGDHLARRSDSKAYRFSMTLFPVIIMLLGLVIGFVALSVFLPLIQLLDTVGR